MPMSTANNTTQGNPSRRPPFVCLSVAARNGQSGRLDQSDDAGRFFSTGLRPPPERRRPAGRIARPWSLSFCRARGRHASACSVAHALSVPRRHSCRRSFLVGQDFILPLEIGHFCRVRGGTGDRFLSPVTAGLLARRLEFVPFVEPEVGMLQPAPWRTLSACRVDTHVDAPSWWGGDFILPQPPERRRCAHPGRGIRSECDRRRVPA